MKKLAVVLGVAAVATLTGCRDQDYDARRSQQVQNEPKSIETTPVKPAEATAKTVETKTVTTTTEIKTIESKCLCAPGTKHTAPCTCGASDCRCIVVKSQPVEPEYTIYIVQNGDYLAKVSKKFNLTINSIKRLNNMKSDTIRVGQKLKLPGKIDVGVQTAPVSATAKAAASTTGKTAKKSFAAYTGATKEYIVKNGDTLGSVAYGNGCNIRQLKQLNNLTSDSLKIGQKLKVPADKAAAKATNATAKKAETAKPAEAEVKKADAAKSVVPETTPAIPVEAKPEAAEEKKVEAPAPVAATEEKKAEADAKVATTTYVVQEGEDLTRIAVDFGVTTSVIRELNNLGEGDAVKPGQVLKLPAEAQQ